ncbi:MAG: WhiB family transcriptional regulator [Propionibacteriaceae bacterium]|nr:WhiB family transcriptional regulator [Propionibacteriaceae bacterium]
MSTSQVEDWTMQAKCRGSHDDLFADSAEQKKARVICYGCLVRNQCLAEALDNHIKFGVWGGMTERERRQLLRQRSDVTNWASVLCSNPNRVIVT